MTDSTDDDDFTDNVFSRGAVGVVTGAASGIGRAAAKSLLDRGMKVAMIDNDAARLGETVDALARHGEHAGRIMALPVDVADRVAMVATANRVVSEWGAPSFVMNNAAVHVHGGPGNLEGPPDVWRRVIDVNVFGVLNGVAGFVPAMREAGTKGMVVITGSKQGITHPPGNPVYNVSKAAVNAYAMNLARELRDSSQGLLSAHLLVPGWTTTGQNEHQAGAWRPEQVVQFMFEALARSDFYILCPDDETSAEIDRKRIAWQAGDMISNRPALSRWHPAFKEAFERFMHDDG